MAMSQIIPMGWNTTPTEAVVNRDPKGERILELLQENKALRAKVARLEAHIDRCLTEVCCEKKRKWIV